MCVLDYFAPMTKMKFDFCAIVIFLLKRPIMLLLVLCICMIFFSYCLETRLDMGIADDNENAPTLHHFRHKNTYYPMQEQNPHFAPGKYPDGMIELAKSMQQNLGMERAPLIRRTQEHVSMPREGKSRNITKSNSMNFTDVQYLIHNVDLCRDSEVFIVIHVPSAAKNFHERDLIRKTWGSVKHYNNHNIRVVFFLGQTNSTTVQHKIKNESLIHKDVVQTNVIDSYKNLTYKHVGALKWIMDHCSQAKFIVKADDDCLVNVYRLVDFLLEKFPSHDASDYLYCSVFYNIGPVRNKLDKWYVSEAEYPKPKYPPYCEGFAYIMSPDLPSKLYQASLRTPYFWIDDVYVTGFLVRQLGVIHSLFRSPYSYEIMKHNHASAKVNKTLFVLAKYYKDHAMWLNVWDAAKKYSMRRQQEL